MPSQHDLGNGAIQLAGDFNQNRVFEVSPLAEWCPCFGGNAVLLALVVIASISLVGIVLVNALLVIPAATAKLLARSLRHKIVVTCGAIAMTPEEI